jgi:hypothetical protein
LTCSGSNVIDTADLFRIQPMKKLLTSAEQQRSASFLLVAPEPYQLFFFKFCSVCARIRSWAYQNDAAPQQWGRVITKFFETKCLLTQHPRMQNYYLKILKELFSILYIYFVNIILLISEYCGSDLNGTESLMQLLAQVVAPFRFIYYK